MKDIKMKNDERLWWQFIIADPEYATGSSVLCFLKELWTVRQPSFVLVFGAHWLIECFDSTAGATNVRVTTEDLSDILPGIVQIDWADFLLFGSERDVERIIELDSPWLRFAQADVSVRVADNSYFYVYTREEAFRAALASRYPDCDATYRPIDKLEIPF
jgi:hypothetical protein